MAFTSVLYNGDYLLPLLLFYEYMNQLEFFFYLLLNAQN